MDNKFVFIACSYNMSNTLQRMLHSIVGQSYENWRIIIIDDCSSSTEQIQTSKIIFQFQELLSCTHLQNNKIDIIWNSDARGKQWEVSNVLYGISKCADNDIICRIDADDWLIDLDALSIINQAYQSGCEALWTAHRWGFSDRNISGPMSNDADPYMHSWVSSHLKTFRKRLINGVPYENFVNMNNVLVRRAGDQSIYLPVLHNTKRRFFLPRAMYHYSIDEQNGAVYKTDDALFQKQEADFIRARGYVSDGISWEEKTNKL